MWRKGKPHALLVGMQIGAAMVENSMKFPQKLKIEQLLAQRFHCWKYTLGILKHQFKRIYAHLCFSSAITIVKIWKQPKCPSVNEWTKKDCGTFT